MAFVVKDRVQETSTTTGTGTFTLNGAVTGFKSFSVVGNGNTTYYAITTSGSEFEVGIGTYTSSGTTLSRDTVLSSSNSNNLVDFAAGAKNVFVTYPAERSIYLNSAGSEVVVGKNNTDTSVTTDGTADITISTNSGTNSGTVKIFDGVNGNIEITPNGTGDVVLSADTIKIGDSNTDAVLTTDGTGDITISTNSGSNSGTIKIFDGTNGNIEITPNGTGVVKLDGLSYPIADGTANQVLKTNGSGVLSFTTLSGGFNGSTTTSSAVDITLTSASTQTQFVTMTAADKAVILPDATTLSTKGFPIFVIINNGFFPFTVRNNGGYTLVIIQPNTSVEFTLVDNSTSNGSFATDANAVNLGLTQITTVKSGTTGASTTHAHANPWNFGVCADKLSSTSAIIFYVAGTSNRDVYGVVVSYSGTTITVNSETLLYNGSSTAATCFTSVMLDSTTGLIIVGRTSNKVAVPFTISGTTISVGSTSSTFGAGTGSAGGFSKPVAASSTLACLFDNTATDATTFKLRTIQHNGASAPTIGSQSSVTITVAFDEAPPALSVIDSTTVFIAYSDTTTDYTIARTATLSGTSAPTINTANTSSVTVNTYDRYTCGVIKVSSTEFLYLGSNGTDRYTVSGTTVTYDATSLFSSANTLIPVYYNATNISFGNFAIKFLYNYTNIFLLQKSGNFYYAKQSYLAAPETFSYNTGNCTSVPIELDSTTCLIASNNGTTGSKISAYLVKYIGS